MVIDVIKTRYQTIILLLIIYLKYIQVIQRGQGLEKEGKTKVVKT